MQKFDSFPMFLTEDDLVNFWKQYLLDHRSDNNRIQLYIHYPWCQQVCKFCVFGKYQYQKYKDIIPDYELAMIRQIRKMNEVFDIVIPNELYLGGGTASLWTEEFLTKLRDELGCYKKIGYRQTEIHPSNLSNRRVFFYINEMNFDRVSIGVQTFNREHLEMENRIPVDLNRISNAIRRFRDNGIFVNIDLVALFHYSDNRGWDQFKEDLWITSKMMNPNSIFAEPNFKLDDFYGNSIKFREIISGFIRSNPQWHITNKEALSTNYEDIIRYRDLPYELIQGEGASEITNGDFISDRKNEIIIGLGGIDDFTAYSKTPDGFYINAKYLPQEKEFIYTLTKHDKFRDINPSNENDLYNTRVQVGSYTIAPPRRISE